MNHALASDLPSQSAYIFKPSCHESSSTSRRLLSDELAVTDQLTIVRLDVRNHSLRASADEPILGVRQKLFCQILRAIVQDSHYEWRDARQAAKMILEIATKCHLPELRWVQDLKPNPNSKRTRMSSGSGV